MTEQRLIDANALMEDINESLSEMTSIGIAVDGDWLWAKLNDAIEHAPTIEERKTGKWIEDAETYYKAVNEKGGGVDENTPYFTEDYIACSECLTMFSVIDNCTEDFDFCPKCGARLVQEGEEHGQNT